ncbi:WD40 repeat-like protein [Coemansia sp. RSA 2320]|nr:WD40 repeat-like protein [Coemansia sp. RSA 2320]
MSFSQSNLSEPEKAWEYRGHTQATTVARFSPSGYYVASGDVAGNVRIWDAINDEHILKSEVRAISGRVNDISWDMDSQRVMAVGEGKEAFGRVFSYDSGNSVGTVEGHSKVINACTMRQQRPFRAVTCSDDSTCVFYHGAPYKFQSILKDHSGFVYDTKYSPNGDYFVTVGADKKVFLYDGKTGELVRQMGKDSQAAHKGSIYAVSWSPDSKYLLTSSGDRTCKFWDVEKDEIAGTVEMGVGAEHQQVGNVWAGEHIISLSLSGDINVLQMNNKQVVRAITGHQKSITAAVLTTDSNNNSLLYTGSYDGKLCTWDFSSKLMGIARAVEGGGYKHDAKLQDAASMGDVVVLGFIDDAVRFAQDSKVVGGSSGVSAAAESVALARNGTTAIAVLGNGSVVSVDRRKDGEEGAKERVLATAAKQSAEARAIATSPVSDLAAVGHADCSVQLYKLGADGQLEATPVVVKVNTREITRMAFSPCGQLLAIGDAGGKIAVVQTSTGKTVTTRWCAHTARIYGLAWTKDSQHVASCSLDGHVIVWSVESPLRKIVIKNAHLGGSSSAAFVDKHTVVSTGADGGVKVWQVVY